MTTSSTSLSTPGFDNLSRTVWGMFFGEEIHSLREQKELSIEEAACRAGMTVPQWEAIETGRVPRRWEQISAMADSLKEKRVAVASLVIRYAAAWEGGPDLPGEIMQRYS